MERKAVFGIILALLSIGMLTLAFKIQPAKAEPRTWTVDDDGQANFHTIQEAINAAIDGDAIFVKGGKYEPIFINKTLTLIGTDKSNTFIDGGNKTLAVVTIEENNVALKGFTIKNGTSAGIYISGFNQSTISDNAIILNGFEGICLDNSHGNTIKNNTISSNGYAGLDLFVSHGNRISNNTITFHLWGPGIFPTSSNNSLIYGNTISNNEVGVFLTDCYNNVFYHNNLINNPYWQVDSNLHSNIWDDGYPSGGNYWNDYNGADNFQGSYQNMTGSDGIGETYYNTSSWGNPSWDNPDKYPLMGPFTMFDAGTWNGVTYNVDVVSNSTVSDFTFNPDQKLISFNVTGLDSTKGFCRVTIPNVMLSGPYEILVSASPVTPNKLSVGDHTFLYFTYGHSTKTVTIRGAKAIPEFASAIILPLLIVLTMLAVIFAKRKIPRNSIIL